MQSKSFSKILISLFMMGCSCVFYGQETNSNNFQSIVYTPEQQKIRVENQNVRLIADKENGGYHLYVKKSPNINSILLTETTKDPTGKNDSYAYRAKEYNKINGDEKRILNGEFLVSEGAKYSLVDSTPEETDFFGPAFHIYIPQTLVYGYEWSRNGEIQIDKGTFINIRSFEKPYADYTGNYVDNPFMFDFVKIKKPKPKKVVKELPPPPVIEELPVEEVPVEEPEEILEEIEEPEVEEDETVLTDEYNPLAYEKLNEVSKDLIFSKGPETLIQDIRSVLEDDKNAPLDVVFAIDTTGSMKNDMEKLKAEFTPLLEELFVNNDGARVGLLLYRDYGDGYNYMDLPVKVYGFVQNFSSISKNLAAVRIYGKEGGDIPEAVYEAMYASGKFFAWRPESKKRVIIIGDAEPHPYPRKSGKYSKEFVTGFLEEKGIKITTILLPKE